MRRPHDAAPAQAAATARRDRPVGRVFARRLTGWWTLAALLHLLGLMLLLRGPAPKPHEPRERPAARISQQQVGQAIRQARKKQAERPRPAPKPPSVPPKGQVVDLAPAESSKAPKDTRFLAERDSQVDKETSSRATRRPEQRPRLAPAPAAPPAPAPPPPAAPSRSAAPAPRPDAAAPLPRAPSGPRRSMHPDRASEAPAGAKSAPQRDAGLKPPPRALTLAQLIPSMGALAQQPGAPEPPTELGGSVPDIEEGGATLLNARAFRHAGYFNRLMRSVEQFWHPIERYQRLDPAGQLYGVAPRVTVLEVTLDAQGHLVDVHVREPSGIYFLDDEASAAFRRAEPFNHPPAALVDSSGYIRFSVGFHFRIH